MTNFILNRGGWGISISRDETVERLRPIVRRLNELHLLYVNALPGLTHAATRDQLEAQLRITRMDLDKLDETIYSAGGQSFTMTDIGRMELIHPGSEADVLAQLRNVETEILELFQSEVRIKHHIRTQAILANVESNTRTRLQLLEKALREAGQEA